MDTAYHEVFFTGATLLAELSKDRDYLCGCTCDQNCDLLTIDTDTSKHLRRRHYMWQGTVSDTCWNNVITTSKRLRDVVLTS